MARKAKAKEQVNKRADVWLEDVLSSNTLLKIGILADPDKGRIKANKPKKVWVENPGEEGEESTWSKKDSPDLTVVQIGAIHEFGSDKRNIPQRSFLRSTYEEQMPKLNKRLAALAKRLAKQDNYDEKLLMSKLGNWMAGKVKKKFTNNDWDDLQDPTRGGRNKEGQAKPLIDTGQLRASISFQVIETKKNK